MKKSLFTFLRAFISILLIVILLYIMRDKYGQIIEVLRNTNVLIFSIAFAAFLAAVSLAALRLKLIIAAQEIPVTFSDSLSLTFIGYFFNNFLPTAIGGDVIKAYYLSKNRSQKLGSFASIFVDRAIGLFTMVFMAFIALFAAAPGTVSEPIRYSIYAITAGALGGLIVILNKEIAKKFSPMFFFLKPFHAKIKSTYEIVNKYQHHKILMLQSFIISILGQVFFFLSLGILSISIGSKIPFIEIFIRMPIIGIVSLLPSINGLGLREGSTVVFFGPFIGKENAFAVSVLWLFVLLLVSLIGGVIYGVSKQFKVNLTEIEKM